MHKPRHYRTDGESEWRSPFSGIRQHSSADIPGFDDFFTKIEDAVDHEIGDSPYQDARSGNSAWESPRHDGDDTDEQPDGVADNSGDLRPTVYNDAVKPDSLGFRMPSHAELEENYKTEVTSGSQQQPIVAAAAAFEPKRTNLPNYNNKRRGFYPH